MLVDATNRVTAVHQNHDYQHAKGDGTATGLWAGEEARRNYSLANGYLYDLLVCPFQLTAEGIRPFRDREHVWRRVERLERSRPSVFRLLLSWKMRYLVCRLFPRF